MELSTKAIQAYKARLQTDAAQAREDMESPVWLETDLWPQYMAKSVYKPLYLAFSNRELEDILRQETKRLNRLPNKKDVFCVYRLFIIQRYQNWPKALVAAGLKPPRRVRRAANRLRVERSEAIRKQWADSGR